MHLNTAMPHLSRTLLVVLFIGVIITAGCTTLTGEKNPDINASATPTQPVASYRVTINQPAAQSGFVKTDTDIYNIGEVVEFTITNDGPGTLDCAGDPPSYAIIYQTRGGTWTTQTESGTPDGASRSTLAPGASTQAYRFVTGSMEPGRYRIVHDCGVEREILIRTPPAITTAPVICPAVNASGATRWIDIDPVGEQYVGRPITIRGRTNIPLGQVLKYTIVSAQLREPVKTPDTGNYFKMVVQEGNCGINTWSAGGEIRETGEFVIVISDAGGNVTALRRFTVSPV